MTEPYWIGVAGLGFLGRGIAACLLARGYSVIAWTTGDDTHPKARAYIEDAAEEMVAHQVVPAEEARGWSNRYREAESLADFAPCRFVIESVKEDFAIKQHVFDQVEAAVLPTVPIASNTSALPISSLQASRQHPGRFLGMHWAEPAYATRFLELIRGDQTGEDALQQAFELGLRLEKDPAIVNRDVPGFIVNRLGYAMYREAMHLVESGVADVETVDRAFQNACGLWATFCGPFRWIDITGGPALYAKAMSGVLPTLANSTELPEILRMKLQQGEQGAKDGRGFYEYVPGEERHWNQRLHEHAWTVWELQKRYSQEKTNSGDVQSTGSIMAGDAPTEDTGR